MTDEGHDRQNVAQGIAPYNLAIYGAGDLLADLGSSSGTATKVRGQFGFQLLLPDMWHFCVAFNATDLSGTLTSNDRAAFGASIVNTELGPYAFSVDAEYSGIQKLLGAYFYGKISAYQWSFDDGSMKPPAYSALPYAVGFGGLLAFRADPKDIANNNFYVDAGLGVALRGVGGDVTQDARLDTFIGRDKARFLAPEARFSVEFNAIRATASILYFSAPGIDGLSDVRLVVSLGAAGDAIRFSPAR